MIPKSVVKEFAAVSSTIQKIPQLQVSEKLIQL